MMRRLFLAMMAFALTISCSGRCLSQSKESTSAARTRVFVDGKPIPASSVFKRMETQPVIKKDGPAQ
jgi:hypothetical protein